MPTLVYPFDLDGFTIFVEVDEEVDTINEDGVILTSKKTDTFNGKNRKISHAIDLIKNISNKLLETSKAISPDEMELELGIKFKGELGVPFIAKTASESTLKFTLRWKKDKEVKS